MKAQHTDIDQLMRIMERAFDPRYGEAWSRRQVEDSLMFPANHYRLMGAAGGELAEDGEAAGFYLSRTGFREEELLLLAVAPECRRRGLGRSLINDLLRSAKARGAERVFLEMRRGNPAETLYRASGFRQIGERPNYYRGADGGRIDALTFGVDL